MKHHKTKKFKTFCNIDVGIFPVVMWLRDLGGNPKGPVITTLYSCQGGGVNECNVPLTPYVSFFFRKGWPTAEAVMLHLDKCIRDFNDRVPDTDYEGHTAVYMHQSNGEEQVRVLRLINVETLNKFKAFIKLKKYKNIPPVKTGAVWIGSFYQLRPVEELRNEGLRATKKKYKGSVIYA